MRRHYDAEYQVQVMAECDVLGASVAKVAMADVDRVGSLDRYQGGGPCRLGWMILHEAASRVGNRRQLPRTTGATTSTSLDVKDSE